MLSQGQDFLAAATASGIASLIWCERKALGCPVGEMAGMCSSSNLFVREFTLLQRVACGKLQVGDETS